MSICERCTREVEDDEIGQCPLCEADGLCSDCQDPVEHDCKPEPRR